MWCFKVVECDNPEHSRDDWDMCPFAHVGEVVTRRPPQTHLPKLCPKARRACRKGRACPYAHNVFEHWLHPSRFKTEICQHGASCNRPMCFFAHYSNEIRSPSPSADEVMAAAEAAGLLGRPHANSQHGAASSCGTGPRGACSSGSSSGCSRRSSLTSHELGLGGAYGCAPAMAPAWLGQAQALRPPPAQRHQAPHFMGADRLSADLALAQADLALAQCLQAQQAAAAAVQQQQAAAAAGWGTTSDWAMLSSGGSSPTTMMATPRDASPPGLMGATAFGTPSPPLSGPTLGAPLGTAAPFNLWSLTCGAPHPPAQLSAAGGGAPLPPQALSTEGAFLLLAGLPRNSASDYLCALQAEQARFPSAAPSFY